MPCAYRHEGLFVLQHLGNKWIGQMGSGRSDPGPTRDEIGGCDHDRATSARKLLDKNGLELFLRIAPNQVRQARRCLPQEGHTCQTRRCNGNEGDRGRALQCGPTNAVPEEPVIRGGDNSLSHAAPGKLWMIRVSRHLSSHSTTTCSLSGAS